MNETLKFWVVLRIFEEFWFKDFIEIWGGVGTLQQNLNYQKQTLILKLLQNVFWKVWL